MATQTRDCDKHLYEFHLHELRNPTTTKPTGNMYDVRGACASLLQHIHKLCITQLFLATYSVPLQHNLHGVIEKEK